MKLYEAMFLVDSNRARQDHAKVVEELTAVLQKGGAQVVNCDKWDERKLAYPIAKRRRGTYYLAHFRAEGEAIGRIERAASLDEAILRVLITVDEDGEAFPVFEVEPDEEGFGGGRPDRDSRGGRDRDRDSRGGRDRDGHSGRPGAVPAGEPAAPAADA